MADSSQTIFSKAFSWIKIYEFSLIFHWSVFPRVQLTIYQHWFGQWLGTKKAASFYLNQYGGLICWHIYTSLGLNKLKSETRWVDGTQTSEVTPVTIQQILTHHLYLSRSNLMVIEVFSSIYRCTFHFVAIKPFWADITNCIFDLENSGSRSWPRSNPMVTFEV